WVWVLFGILIVLSPLFFFRIKSSFILLLSVFFIVIYLIVILSLDGGKTLSTMWTRVYLNYAALNVLLHDPFYAVFGSAQMKMWFASAMVSDLQYDNAHNTFLNQAVNFGFPALLAYTGMIFYSIKSAFNVIKNDSGLVFSSDAKLSIACLFSISGQYYFEPAAESSGYALTLMFFICLPIVMGLIQREIKNA
ncbi:MAG: hypothetical protein NTU49_00010, partial [Gammaproteobacteria bacterium]|nr:hypothetical protein [Gammaproteobacteria bacterium]